MRRFVAIMAAVGASLSITACSTSEPATDGLPEVTATDVAAYGTRRYTRSEPPPSAVDLYDCRDFASSREAQRSFLAAGGPSADPYDLDRDGDGFACEYDPRREYRERQQPAAASGSNCHWVGGYYRKDGTPVRGHMRCR